MDCVTARKLIQVLLDGELPDSQSLEAHITGCTACSQELARQKALMYALDAWQSLEPRLTYADFRDRVAYLHSRQRRRWWHPIWNPSPRWAPAVLVAMAFLGGSVSGWYHDAHLGPHSHVLTADMRQVSDSLGLDTFSDGLSDVVIADAGEVAK